MWCLLLSKGLLPVSEMFHMLGITCLFPAVCSDEQCHRCGRAILPWGILRHCHFMDGLCKDCAPSCVAW